MVPSDRGKEPTYTSATNAEGGSSLSSHVAQDALERLQGWFDTQQQPKAEETREAEPQIGVETPSHLGDAALVDVVEVPSEPEVIVVHEAAPTPRPPRHSPAKHHHTTVQGSKTHAQRPRSRTATPVIDDVKPFSVKTQEELWGAKDTIKPEDVPEGEMTYEQYLAQRPKAEEGAVIHRHDKNGRELYYDANTNKRVKKQVYEDTTAKQAAETNRQHEAVNAVSYDTLKDQSYEGAVKENGEYDKGVQDTLRAHAEAKVVIEKSPQLKGLSVLGKELLDLRDGTVKRKQFTPELEATLAAKETAFKDLFELYKEKGLDSRGLSYIEDTLLKRYDDVDYKPRQGSATFEGVKVAVHDVIESPDGDKAYVIQDRDGERQTVQASNVEFTQEFEAPQQSLFERSKAYFKKWGADWREFGGKAAFSARWDNAKDWLMNRHITEEMTPEQMQEQKEKNRRNNLLGGAAIIAGSAVAVGLSIWAGTSIAEHISDAQVPQLNPDKGVGVDLSQPHLGVESQASQEAAAQAAAEAQAQAQAEALSQAIQNPNYDIASGGGGIQMFESVGLNEDAWNAHAGELVSRFPTEFYYDDNGGVGIMNPGWLSEDARRFIEGLKG